MKQSILVKREYVIDIIMILFSKDNEASEIIDKKT
jgi:hypothetical protein